MVSGLLDAVHRTGDLPSDSISAVSARLGLGVSRRRTAALALWLSSAGSSSANRHCLDSGNGLRESVERRRRLRTSCPTRRSSTAVFRSEGRCAELFAGSSMSRAKAASPGTTATSTRSTAMVIVLRFGAAKGDHAVATPPVLLPIERTLKREKPRHTRPLSSRGAEIRTRDL